MKNKYIAEYGFFKILPFQMDLIIAIKLGDSLTRFETLLTDAYLKECICTDEIYRTLLTMIKLASGKYSVEDLIFELPEREKKKEE